MSTLLNPCRSMVAPPARPQPLRTFDANWLVVLAIPALLFCFTGADFFYDPPGWLDPFYYMGYFLHYSEHVPHLDAIYKSSRLPWILPGWVCYQTFGPHAGHLILQLATLLFDLTCVYLLLRRSLDSATAIVAVCVLGTGVWFHGVGGWSYHMMITIGYFFLAVLALDRAARSDRGQGWYALSGAAFMAAVHTHLFMATLGPGLVLQWLLNCRAALRRPHGRDIVAVLAGTVGITVLLAAINAATGGSWSFYMPQINWTLHLANDGNQWHRSLAVWLPRASYLMLPLAALLGFCLTPLLLRFRKAGFSGSPIVLGYQLQALLALIFAAYSQFVKKQTILDSCYASGVLFGPALLGVAGFVHLACGSTWQRRPHRAGWIALTLLAGSLLGIANLGVRFQSLAHRRFVFSVSLAALAIVVLAWLGRKRVGLAVGLLLFGLGNCFAMRTLRGDCYDWHGPTCCRDTFDFILDAERFFQPIDPSLKSVRFWTRPGEQCATANRSGIALQGCVASLASARCCNEKAPPRLEAIDRDFIADASLFAVVSCCDTHAATRDEVQQRLEKLGYHLHLEGQRAFHHGDLHLATTVWRLQAHN